MPPFPCVSLEKSSTIEISWIPAVSKNAISKLHSIFSAPIVSLLVAMKRVIFWTCWISWARADGELELRNKEERDWWGLPGIEMKRAPSDPPDGTPVCFPFCLPHHGHTLHHGRGIVHFRLVLFTVLDQEVGRSEHCSRIFYASLSRSIKTEAAPFFSFIQWIFIRSNSSRLIGHEDKNKPFFANILLKWIRCRNY